MKYVAFLILLPATFLLSQNYKQKIQGSVRDKKTQELLQGVNVVVEGSNYGAASNEKGYFDLSLLPGKYVLKISLIGFYSLIDTIKVNSNQNDSLKYELEEAQINAIVDKALYLPKEEAERDISEKHYRIFMVEYNDSIKSVTEKVASKYGFTVFWPDDVYMIISVGEYNEIMIKYLEKRNGKNWYQRFLKEVDIALKR